MVPGSSAVLGCRVLCVGAGRGQEMGTVPGAGSVPLHSPVTLHDSVPLCPLWDISCPMCPKLSCPSTWPLSLAHGWSPVPCRADPVPIPPLSLLPVRSCPPAWPPLSPGLALSLRAIPVAGVAPGRCRVPAGAWPVKRGVVNTNGCGILKGCGRYEGGVACAGSAAPAFRVRTGRAEPNRDGPGPPGAAELQRAGQSRAGRTGPSRTRPG